MKIALTGTSSGVGKELCELLSYNHDVLALNRELLDLSNIEFVTNFNMPTVDMLINMAGTDVGGKIEFAEHLTNEIVEILNTNLIAPVILSQKALKNNKNCKIVNVTSTNNKRYYPNNLSYSLSKKALEDFTNILQIEYPNAKILEVRLGLTKTNFNNNRFKNHPDRYQDIYHNTHLEPDFVANKIHKILFEDSIKFVEISP